MQFKHLKIIDTYFNYCTLDLKNIYKIWIICIQNYLKYFGVRMIIIDSHLYNMKNILIKTFVHKYSK